jgi:hypothetical protein
MKTARRITPNRWTTLPGNRAHGVEDQNSSCSNTRAAKQKEIQPMASCFFLTSPFIELIRWDEKAGLLAGCDTLPIIDVLEAQEKGDRL